ncbi:MAG: hydrogenase large subunit [Candidatus Odinarchaeia archaeon]
METKEERLPKKLTLADEIRVVLKEMLTEDYLEEYKRYKNRWFILTKPEHVREIAKYMLSRDARITHLTASDLGIEGFEVAYHYALDHLEKDLHITVKVRVPREKPEVLSLSPITWQISWAEREMMELVGVNFLEHPDPRHQFLPYEWPELPESEKVDGFKLYNLTGKSSYQTRKELGKWVPLPISPSDSKLHLVPVGPYHPMFIESEYFRIKLEKEDIVDVDMKTGFNHRGIMRLAESRSYARIPYLVQRVCGICSTTHAVAYCNTVEYLAGVDIPDRAKLIRTIILELERIHSHLIWLAVAGDLIGFKTLFMWALRDREHILDLFEILTNGRVHHESAILGGVRKNIEKEDYPKILKRMKFVEDAVKKYTDIAYDHPVVRKRTEDIGVLSLTTAKDAGAVGPTARGSGWKIDVRWSDPYAAYGPEYTTWDVIVEDTGDVWARVVVRLKELLQSISIIRQCLDKLDSTSEELTTPIPLIEPGMEALGKTEAPRGELTYYLRAGDVEGSVYGTSKPHTVRIRTPSYRNDAVLPFMLVGNNIADAAIIIGSIDPCFSCTDRMVILEDAKTGKLIEKTTVGNLIRRYRERR